MRRLLPAPAADVDLEAAYAVEGDVDWHVRASFITSADGAVALDGHSAGLGNAADKAIFGLGRDLADVILVGAGTARAEGYGAPAPTGERLARRRRHGLPDAPVLALVSARLDLDVDGELFKGPNRQLVITHASAPADRLARLAEVADVLVTGDDEVDLAAAVARLRGRGFRRCHLEGGPRLFGTALAAALVDELCLTIAPLLAGPGAARIVSGPVLPTPATMSPVHVLEEAGYLFVRYRVRAGAQDHGQ